MISKTFSRRPRTVDTTHKALVAFAAGVLLCLQPVKAAIIGGTNTLEHVPYSTLMWSAADPFGFGAISNLQNAAGVTAQDVTNAVTYNLVPYASHTSNPTIHTTPATVTNIAQYLLLPYSTTADLLGLSNVLSAVDAVFQTGKVSQAQWTAGSNAFEAAIGTLSTQRVSRVWSTDGSQFAETGVVWQASQVTNYTVALSADFEETVTHTRPVWSTGVFPFVDDFLIGDFWDDGKPQLTFDQGSSIWGTADTVYPYTLTPSTAAQGTAVVSQHLTAVYSYVKTYAATADLTAVSNLLNGVSASLASYANTNLTATTAALQPSVLVRYGDFAVTNTDGYAAFTNANPAQKTRIISSPTLGTSLAKARWQVASTLAGTLSVSAYAQSGLFTPAASNCAAYVVLSLYTAGGAVVASNIGATVSIDKGAVSNISATVALAAPATNGYVVAEVFSGTNAVNLVVAHSGGSYPFTLSGMNTPLNYLVESKADSKYVAINNGTLVNPTVAGPLTIGGVSRDSWPEATADGIVTNGMAGLVATNGMVVITGAESDQFRAPLVVQNTTPYGPPYTQHAQVWLDPYGGLLAVMRVDGAFRMMGRVDATSYNLTGPYGVNFQGGPQDMGDPDMGVLRTPTWAIRYPSQGVIRFDTYGTNRMTVGASGNIAMTGSLSVTETNTAAEVRSTGGYIIGPTISGKQARIFTDGTNCFFVNVNSVTNALTTN